MADAKKTEPLRRGDFGLATHRYQQFDAVVPAQTTKEQLVDPTLWVNVAPSINSGDEIRARAEDDSFTAKLHVTYSVGNQVRLKLIYFAELDAVDHAAMADASSFYEIKQRGVKKWCVVQRSDGKVIKELIPTQLEAMKEMADLNKALAA